MSSVLKVKEKDKKRRVRDSNLPVYIPPDQPETHMIVCGRCHKKVEVPIYRINLCNPCFRVGDAGTLELVSGADKETIAGFVRGNCPSDFEIAEANQHYMD